MRIEIAILLLCGACRATIEGWENEEELQPEYGVDEDRDGWLQEEDCDDTDGSIHPEATEICDEVDNNCDGQIDEGVLSTFYSDADSDGYGDPENPIQTCTQPSGSVPTATDCDDAEADTWPGAPERCDEEDNDCDGQVDEGIASQWYADSDGDGFGDPDAAIEDCDPPSGYVEDDTDCDDSTIAVWPGANEICDEIDNDCDGAIDEDVGSIFYLDADGDGFGLADSTVEACSNPSGYSDISGDCEDGDSDIHPEATEVCDGIDNDCDGDSDGDDATDLSTWYRDADGDGYGNSDETTDSCELPTGYVEDSTDCDDGEDDIHPDATEICDGIDNNCDGATDQEDASDPSTWYLDSDGDGFGDADFSTESCEAPSSYLADDTDCEDTDPEIHPDADESCDGIDNNCDGSTDGPDSIDLVSWYPDYDGDGYGDAGSSYDTCEAPSWHIADDTDCDDGDAEIHPDAEEICDEVDNDCDGDIDEDDSSLSDIPTWYLDYDGDGYGSTAFTSEGCEAPSGYSEADTDCDDGDSDIHPEADEVCDGEDNDCDGLTDDADSPVSGTDSFFLDADGDGYGDEEQTTEACELPSGYSELAEDCDDTDATLHPDATEICDGEDNDCDGDSDDADSDLAYADTWYLDYDSDGFGSSSFQTEACEMPAGYVEDAGDCDDLDRDIHPDATEVCDGEDNDCNGDIDEDDPSLSDPSTWYLDDDGDGHGDSASSTEACEAPSGYVADDTDCDDSDSAVSPSTTEVCDELDNDCDGATDEDDAADATTWYFDDDEDGWGDDDTAEVACEAPSKYYVDTGGDCDDTDADLIDNCVLGTSCNDILDNGLSSGDGSYTIDVDGEGSGEPSETVFCDMSTDGGGWTLVATNADNGDWNATEVVIDIPLGWASLSDDYKAEAWTTVLFEDLMFEDGSLTAIYEGIGDESQSWYDFQAAIPHHNCGSSDGYQYSMTAGDFSGADLCDTDLYIHPLDEDGGINSSCSEYSWQSNSSGPSWSSENNDGCPLDDPGDSNFYSHDSRLPWSTTDPLRMWVR